jgi:hypothetical protein
MQLRVTININKFWQIIVKLKNQEDKKVFHKNLLNKYIMRKMLMINFKKIIKNN